MSDRDTITLPREVARLALSYIEWYIENEDGGRFVQVGEAAEALRTALAAEQPKPEPVATVGTQSNAAWKGYDGRWSPPGDPIKVVHLLRDLPLGTLLYTAPPEDEALRRDAERLREKNERLREENRLWYSRAVALFWKCDTDNITVGRLQSAAKEIDAALRREDV